MLKLVNKAPICVVSACTIESVTTVRPFLIMSVLDFIVNYEVHYHARLDVMLEPIILRVSLVVLLPPISARLRFAHFFRSAMIERVHPICLV